MWFNKMNSQHFSDSQYDTYTCACDLIMLLFERCKFKDQETLL